MALVASVAGMVLVASVAGRVQVASVDGMVLGPVVLKEEGDEDLVVLAGEVEQAPVPSVVVVAGVILLVLVDVAGVIFLVLVDAARVILPVLVDEVGEISLVDVVGGGVDLVGGDVLTEAHMIGTSQMDGEDSMAVEDLATRVGIGATAAAQIEADREAMTDEVIVGALVGAGAGHVAGAAAGAGAGAATAAGVAAGAGAMAQDRSAGPEQDLVLMCCHLRLELDLL
uniref:Uncharacterized protein n=1 Tax=Arundo donax TaxID=35708 RepID=A0A0A9CPZ5_ARUDO